MLIVLITLLQILLFFFLKTDGKNPTLENTVGVSFVCVNAGIILCWAIARNELRKWLAWIVIGLSAREFLLLADYFQWFPVAHSGNDTEAFATIAVQNFSSGTYYEWLTNYTDLLTTLYFITGPVRLIAQQLNVALGMGVMFVSFRIFEELGFTEKQQKLGAAFLALFPHLCVFSAILLREAPIHFCLACSALFFIRWMKGGGLAAMTLSVLFVGAAAWFHGGAVFWCCGYLAALAIYLPASRTNKLSIATIGGVFLGGLLVVAAIPLMDHRVEAMATTLGEGDVGVDGASNAEHAGSAYLEWLTISNPYLLLLFSPLKMFYFLFSPIPSDWRNATDVVAFVLDSTFYIWAFWRIWRGLRRICRPLQKNVVRYLLLSILAMTFVYGYGTISAGTALRHRCKFFPELLVCVVACSVATDRKKFNPRISRIS